MDYVVERTHIIDHPKFLAAGAAGRDLWEWGMKYSGRHELDGELPLEAVLTSPWGAGTRSGNRKLADHLVSTGLWERTPSGYRVLRWVEQGNKTKAELDVIRAKWAKKKRAERSRMSPEESPGDVEIVSEKNSSSFLEKGDEERGGSSMTSSQSSHDDGGVCPSGSLASVLNSPSLSSSEEDLTERKTAGVLARPAGVQGGRPLLVGEVLTSARLGMFEALVQPSGETLDPDATWDLFVDDRIKRSQIFGSEQAIDADWRNWVRRQVKWTKERRMQEADRAKRFGPAPGAVEHEQTKRQQTPEEARRFADELAKRIVGGLKP